MSDFDALLAQYTEKGAGKVHGGIYKCVDKTGKEIYSKISGYDSLADDAKPLREDAVFKIGSATKLLASIALLQCIDRGLISLDEPLTHIIPELDGKEVVSAASGGGLAFDPSKNKITARQLLTHTSGLGYPFTHPLLGQWRMSPAGQVHKDSRIVPDRYNAPLAFEPGQGWLYGSSLEWAGVVVRRLHGGMSLEDYMNDNIWKRVGLSSPFPTFNISKFPDYHARMMRAAERTPEGGLRPYEFPMGDNPYDQEGGSGLALTAKDFLAVLADLVSDAPKLLKSETIAMMFTPQIEEGSAAKSMLLQLRPAWDAVSGPLSNEYANHGLGGMVFVGPAPEIGQPANILAWGGALNTVWFASRELGVAGFSSTQISPFGDSKAKKLVNAWKKEFFANYAPAS
ncbi:beta-lactamase/transpeptidase-like protein [Thozetella sp. PMI_491]|nr:beta-lactamase/transpeptidase-like protein [Thozetella sp. PMI_491]